MSKIELTEEEANEATPRLTVSSAIPKPPQRQDAGMW